MLRVGDINFGVGLQAANDDAAAGRFAEQRGDDGSRLPAGDCVHNDCVDLECRGNPREGVRSFVAVVHNDPELKIAVAGKFLGEPEQAKASVGLARSGPDQQDRIMPRGPRRTSDAVAEIQPGQFLQRHGSAGRGRTLSARDAILLVQVATGET